MTNRIISFIAIVGLSCAGAACQSSSTASNSDYGQNQQNWRSDKMPSESPSASNSQNSSYDNNSNLNDDRQFNDANNRANNTDTPGNVGTNLNGNVPSANER